MVNDFKFCSECGSKISSIAKFCECCGTKQQIEPEIADSGPINPENKKELLITVNVEKFKEILIHSWHLLPTDKQAELASHGIRPSNKKQ